MMYKKGVRKLETFRNSLDSHHSLLVECLANKPKIPEGVEEFICHCCAGNISKGKIPAQAIANGLELFEVPDALANLCDLEVRLISQIIPFSKIVTLRGGTYHGVKGHSVCVPVEPDKVTLAIKRLPRKLSD